MGLGIYRSGFVAGLRVLTFALLLLALAQPIIRREDNTETVVAVVDVSASMTDSELDRVGSLVEEQRSEKGVNEVFKVVTFDSSARLLSLDAEELKSNWLSSLRKKSNPSGTGKVGSALADALELAGALIRHDGRGEILLYTDGMETGGDGEAAAWRLADRGITVSSEEVNVERVDEAVLRSVEIPATGGAGATVDLFAEIETDQARQVELTISSKDDGGEDAVTEIKLKPGRQRVSCKCLLRGEGVTCRQVSLRCPKDVIKTNNSLPVATYVNSPKKIGVLEGKSSSSTAQALGLLLEEAAVVEQIVPSSVTSADSLREIDFLVIPDMPASSVGDDALTAIRNAAIDGMGLLLTGGRRSFGSGGYANTSLTEILPVRFSQEIERRDPSATLVVIIDTSGSMGGARVNLAKEIARLAIARLKPHDKVGVVEFYGSKRWAAPIQPASNAIDLQRALNRLSAGGGTVILPAIEEAFYALKGVKTRTKHVLVLTDGGVEQGAFEPLIREMSDNAITLSTVLVGPGRHSSFLSQLAQWGRGRFYTAPDRYNLPEIIVKQPESSLLTPFVERPGSIICESDNQVVRGMDFTTAPELAGYVQTQARPTADVLLRSSFGHPVLVNWQYGLGQVSVFTSQLPGEWSEKLMQWPQCATLFSNLVRTIARPGPAEAISIKPVLRPGAVELEIKTRLSHGINGMEPLIITATDDKGNERERVADPVRADYWNVRFERLLPGTHHLAVHTVDGRLAAQAAVAVPPVREVTSLGVNRDLFDGIAAIQNRALEKAGIFRQSPATRPFNLWPVLVSIALIMFLLNILLRRWPVRSSVVKDLVILMFFAITTSGHAGETADLSMPDTVKQLSPDMTRAIDLAISEPDPLLLDERFDNVIQMVLEKEGNLDKLLTYLRQPGMDSIPGKRLLARAAVKNGELELARNIVAELVGNEKDDIQLWSSLAQLEELLGHDEAALEALQTAIGLNPEPPLRFALGIRCALLAYDGEEPLSGSRQLENAVLGYPDRDQVAPFCAQLASLKGDYALALELLKPAGSPKQVFHSRLFRGLWLMRTDKPEAAMEEFDEAYIAAKLGHDRTFALERYIAAARCSNNLVSVAEKWLKEPDLPVDKLAVLVGVLRELERFDDALEIMKRPGRSEEHMKLINSPEFQREVIALAVAAGKEKEAESAYRKLIDKNPQQVDWYSGLARLLLMNGRADEAAALFNEALEHFDKSPSLMLLAEAARELALDELALTVARKAGKRNRNSDVRAILFEADLMRHRGDTNSAMSLLRELVSSHTDDKQVILQVAEAFERYGDKAQALQLFRRLYELTGSEDVLLRLAWLLEENKKTDEAFALWEDMWKTTNIPARLRQAQERLLSLAVERNQLADLAIDIEERLDEGKASQREVLLLVDIYTTVNDAVSAAEILYGFDRKSENKVATLKRLVQVYLRCEQFGRCNSTLRRLAELDPENAADYLNQIAIIALERRQPYEAKEALAELAKVTDDEATVDEFSAGVLAAIGLNEEAARSYGQMLACHPDRIEGFLLWGNSMRAAGHSDQAISVFQNLVEEAAEDDLFTVAVDGLFNLDAKPVSLQSALRRVYTRIAANPDKMFLYRLAVDLLEALGREEKMALVLEQAVVVAGERRGPILRELMDSALVDNRNSEAIRFGNSLMMLGDEMPPQVFLDLGRAMINSGQFANAQRVFDRAGVGAGFSSIQQQVATFYEQAMKPATADAIIRQLLITEPDNVELLIRSGDLRTQLEQFDRAFEQYFAASDILLKRLPASIAVSGDDVESGVRKRYRRAENVDEMTQFFGSATEGLLGTARTEELRNSLLSRLSSRVLKEISSLDRETAHTLRLSDNPRLYQLAGLYRQVAFAFHQPELADELDKKLLELHPGDRRFACEAVQKRIDWGLYTRAKELVADTQLAVLPVDVRLELGIKTELNKVKEKNEIDAAVGIRLIPLLIMTGQSAEAGRLIPLVQHQDNVEIGELASTMISAAIAVDDYDGLKYWFDKWIDACRPNGGDVEVTTEIKKCVRMTWNHLSEADRLAFLQKLEKLSENQDGRRRVVLDMFRYRLAGKLGLQLKDTNSVLERAASEDTLDISDAVWILARTKPENRAAILRIMVSSRKPGAVRPFLMSLTGAIEDEAELADTIGELFASAPKQRIQPDRAFSTINQGNWNRNPNAPQSGRRLGEIILSERPTDVVVLTATAVARKNADSYPDAAVLAQEAIDALLAVKEPDFSFGRMFNDLASVLNSDDLATVLDDLELLGEVEGETPTLLYAQAILQGAAGKQDKSLAAIQKAYAISPSNRTISRRVINMMEKSGDELALSRILAAHLTKATIMESYEWRTLGNLYVNLHDLENAIRTARNDKTLLGICREIQLARMMGDNQLVHSLFRSLISENRNAGRSFVPTWPADVSPDGLEGYLAGLESKKYDRKNLFYELADMPFAKDEYFHLLRATQPDNRTVPAIVRALSRVCLSSGTADEMFDQLFKAADSQSLTRKDRLLLLSITEQEIPNNDKLEPVLVELLMHTDPADTETLYRLAMIEKRRGNVKRAHSVLSWIVGYDCNKSHSSLNLDKRLKRIDDWLAVTDEGRRCTECERICRSLKNTPLDNPVPEVMRGRLKLCAGAVGYLKTQISEIRKTIQDDSDRRQRGLWAEVIAGYEAAYGSFEDFVLDVDLCVQFLSATETSTSMIDCRDLLPPATALADPDHYAGAIMNRLNKGVDDGSIKAETAVRSICLLGLWYQDNDLPDGARRMLELALKHAGADGSHWLWIADLARRAGINDKYAEIEIRLLRADRLPVIRVPDLLNTLDSMGRTREGDELAVRVAAYSDHPVIEKRASKVLTTPRYK